MAGAPRRRRSRRLHADSASLKPGSLNPLDFVRDVRPPRPPLWRRMMKTVGDWFPERAFHYRSRGSVKYFVLSRRAQIGLAAVTATAIGWATFATIYFVSFDRVMRDKNAEVAQARKGQRELLAEVAGFNARLRDITRNIERSRAELLKLAGREEALGAGDADFGPGERARLAESHAALRNRMRVLSESWALLNERSASLESGLRAVGTQVEQIVGQHAALKRERDALDARVRALEAQLGAERAARLREVEAERQARLREVEAERLARHRDVEAEKLARARELDAGDARYQEKAGLAEERARRLAGTAQERDTLRREREQLSSRLAAMIEEIEAMRGSQRVLIDRVAQQTLKGLDETERVIAATGLNIDRLIAGVGGEPQGGPLIAIKATGEASAEINARLAELHARAERWRRLQIVLPRLPLAAPLDQYRLTSTFGGRRDPFTGGWSAHNGLDFQNAVGTPVQATAPGKVVFAGWRGGYGWLVEIDHGHGVRTRYAHMQQLTVEEGQTVKLREKIGTLGSSGRSSGPHLHYEVVVDGKPVDPQNFLTAGRHVQSR